MKKCMKCGFLTDESNSFCPKCGNKLQTVERIQSQPKADRSKFRKKEAGIVIGLIAFIIAIPLFISSLSDIPSSGKASTNKEPEISESDYRANCQVFDYKDLCRYPDEYEGEFVKVEVRVSQILKDGETYWQGYTDEDGYGYYDNEYVLVDNRARGAVRVLEEDIIVVYGEYVGLVTMERALGSVKVELPCIEVKYIDIVENGFEESTQNVSIEKHMIEPGQVFQNGSYIYFENVEFLFDDGAFSIRNDRSDDVIVTMTVVGVKADGTYTCLQWPAFGGVDQEQYEKDLEENGWAVEQRTNMVRAGRTLNAEFSIYNFGSDYPDPDIDGDGYYDIIFTLHPQTNEGHVTTSTTDPESEIYKLKYD